MQAMATVDVLSGDLRAGSGTTDWWVELAAHLASVPFPARQDELLAGLIRGRAPSRLLMRLACLPRTTRFSSAEAVLAFVAASTGEDGPVPAERDGSSTGPQPRKMSGASPSSRPVME